MQNDNPKYLLVDGSNYLFRSYFGVPKAANFRGVEVNAVYGFFAILRRIAQAVKPDVIIVVFDSETGIVNKIEKQPEYKATRVLSDSGMYIQLPMIKAILEKCNIKWIEPPSHEADDVIGSIATEVACRGEQSYISSNDFDFAQLISAEIILVRDVRGEAIFVTEEQFTNDWGFKPRQYIDYLAIKGDPSDNISGVQGIGRKTASDLIKQYGSVDQLVLHLEDLRRGVSEKIKPELERVVSNLSFLAIDTSLTVDPVYLNLGKPRFDHESLYLIKTNEHLNSLGIGSVY